MIGLSRKKDQFQQHIRQKHRQQYRSNIRKKVDNSLQINTLLQNLYCATANDEIIDIIIKLQNLLENCYIGQIAKSTFELLMPLTQNYIADLLQETLPGYIEDKCKAILCMLTENIELTNGNFSEKSIEVLVKQITIHYISPNYAFYQCLISIANILSCNFDVSLSWEIVYAILKRNKIEDIISSILAIRNEQLTAGGETETPYFVSFEEEEVFIWFTLKYLKLKQFSKEINTENSLLDQLQFYICLKFRIYSNQEKISIDSQSLFKSLAAIISHASLNFSSYRRQIKESAKQIILKNSELSGSAHLFINMVHIKIWDFSIYRSLSQAILWTVMDADKVLESVTRDRIYMSGIFCMFHYMSEEESLEIWQQWESNNLQCLKERVELHKKLEKIQKLIDRYRSAGIQK